MSLLMILCVQLSAQNAFYVSTAGSSTNTGSISSPWNLQYALDGAQAAGKVKAGDTIYLRGGTYTGKFKSTLGFSGAAPILVKNYNQERATINGYTGSINNTTALIINGVNTWYYGLEITSSSTSRISNSSPSGNISFPGDIYTGAGVDIFGQDNKLINCIVHDMTGTGIGAWKSAENNEVYGCLVYNNGFSGKSNPSPTSAAIGRGPGLYIQNSNPLKPQNFINNFIFKNFYIGLEVKAVGQTPGRALNGINIDSNTVFNAGALNYDTVARKHNLYLGSEGGPYNPAENIYMRSNIFYRDETDGMVPFYMSGVLKPAHYRQQNISLGVGYVDSFLYFRNNYVTGTSYFGNINVQNKFQKFDFQDNVLYDPAGVATSGLTGIEYFSIYQPADTIKLLGIWNKNRYYSLTAKPFWREKYQTQNTALDLAGHRLLHNQDMNSTFSNTRPADTSIIRRNKFEPNTFYVNVINNSKSPTYNLPIVYPNFNGWYYTVTDVQNYYGPTVTTGVYNGSSITLPLNLQDVSIPVGVVPLQPKHTNANLGTFIIRFTQAAQPSLCNPPTNLYITNTSNTAVNLFWTGANGATRYVIEKQNGSSWDSIGNTTGLTFTTPALTPNTSYTFRVGTRCAADDALRYSNTAKTSGKYFVAVNGSASNPGTMSSPWTLAYALKGAGGNIKAGDSVFIRGGVYKGNFVSILLNGTAASPIIFKNYNNEPAVIDGYVTKNDSAALNITSFDSYTYFIGLEVKSSAPSKISLIAGDIYTGRGIEIDGSNIKVINCVIHDMAGDGVYASNDAVNAEVYGCLVYNIGYERTGNAYGTGIFVQNADQKTPKVLNNNFVFKNNQYGILAYGGYYGVSMNGVNIDSSTVFNTGAMLTATLGRKYNLLVGGAASTFPAQNVNLRNNVMYRDETDGAGGDKPYNLRYNICFGQSGVTDSNMVFQRNHVIGGGYYGSVYIQSSYKAYNLQYNVFYTPDFHNKVLFANGTASIKGIWNNNSYYSPNNTYGFSDYNFATWKSLYNVDAVSTFSTGRPLDSFFVRRNKYDSSSYYVTVLNHSNLASFTLPLVNSSLAGQNYVIMDVQNYYGQPVASGTYNGSSIVLPMNLTAVSLPVGTVITQPKHTSTGMGTFIIKFIAPPPPAPINPPKGKKTSEQIVLPGAPTSNVIEAYPNPAHNFLRLTMQVQQVKGNLQYQVLNEAGANVGRGRISSNSTMINTSTLPAGYYFIKVFSEAGMVGTKTFIKN